MSNLRHTVETHPNILEVFIQADGNHVFNAYDYQGEKFGQFFEGSPILTTRIVEIKTREEILGKSRNFDTSDKKEFVGEEIRKEKIKNKK